MSTGFLKKYFSVSNSRGTTPLGLVMFCARFSQGSLALLRQKHFGGQATLGFEAESLWDSQAQRLTF